MELPTYVHNGTTYYIIYTNEFEMSSQRTCHFYCLWSRVQGVNTAWRLEWTVKMAATCIQITVGKTL